jgi:hypothetical protein
LKRNTLVINLFAGPGTGKSTSMAHIFAELKWRNVDCEMITEYAKDKVWEGSEHVLENQYYVSGKQYFKLKRIQGKVDVVITDSPILVGLIYGINEPEEFGNLIHKYHHQFNNLNIFLNRTKPYNPNGRVQKNVSEAIEKDIEIKNMLTERYVKFIEMDASRENIPLMVDLIETILNNN